jgi:hypothetical protein
MLPSASTMTKRYRFNGLPGFGGAKTGGLDKYSLTVSKAF